jgi:hypothetical protein
MHGEGVELRAFRGTRRSSVYRAHALRAADATRVRGAAAQLGLPLLASLAPGELDKREARRLADELTRLRASARLLELDDDLTAMAAVANWCARASGPAWLRLT